MTRDNLCISNTTSTFRKLGGLWYSGGKLRGKLIICIIWYRILITSLVFCINWYSTVSFNTDLYQVSQQFRGPSQYTNDTKTVSTNHEFHLVRDKYVLYNVLVSLNLSNHHEMSSISFRRKWLGCQQVRYYLSVIIGAHLHANRIVYSYKSTKY